MIASFHRRRTFVAVVASIGLAVAGAGIRPGSAAAQTNADLRFLPRDAMAVIAAQPARVLADPSMQLLPLEVFAVQGRKTLGFEPQDVERLTAFVQPPQGGPPGFGLIVRLAKPYQSETLLPDLLRNRQAEMLKGKPVYHGAGPMEPSVLLANDRTVVIASRATLDGMLAMEGLESPLGKAAAASLDGDLAAVVLLPPVRPLLQQALAGVPAPPPPFDQLLRLPELVDRIELRQQWTGKPGFTLSMIASSPAAAEEVEQRIVTSLDAGKRMFIVGAGQSGLGMNDPELREATTGYLTRLSDHVAKQIAPRRNGDRVEITIDTASSLQSIGSTGVLAAILLPAVQKARMAATRTQEMNNLKQIGLAFHIYHDSHRAFPPAASRGKQGDKPLLSWRVHLLPYLDASALYQQFHLDEPWDSEHNKTLISKMPAVYRSPDRPQNDGKTVYVAPIGKDTIFPPDAARGTRIADVTDGTSNTILALQVAPENAVVWTQPDDWVYDPQNPFAGLSISPPDILVVLCDGSVRRIPKKIPPETWRRLLLRNDGEPVVP